MKMIQYVLINAINREKVNIKDLFLSFSHETLMDASNTITSFSQSIYLPQAFYNVAGIGNVKRLMFTLRCQQNY